MDVVLGCLLCLVILKRMPFAVGIIETDSPEGLVFAAKD
jgi:hypothetical protein